MSKSTLPQTGAPHAPKEQSSWRLTLFSIVEARRALPYVARIIQDAADAFKLVNDCRSALKADNDSNRRIMIGQRRDAALRRLNAAIDECNNVGVDLLDIAEGIVRFNAHIEGQPATLMWRLGEPITSAWSEAATHKRTK